MFSSSTYTFLHTQKYYVREYILSITIYSSQKFNENHTKKCIEPFHDLDESNSNNELSDDTFCLFSIE